MRVSQGGVKQEFLEVRFWPKADLHTPSERAVFPLLWPAVLALYPVDDIGYAALVKKAARVVGGEAQLCTYLGVRLGWLDELRSEFRETGVYLKLVDLVARHDAGVLKYCDEVVQRATRAQKAAQSARQTALAARVKNLLLQGRAPSFVRDFDGSAARRFLEHQETPLDKGVLLKRALDTAINAAHTTRGNVQMLTSQGVLRIHAQRGFAAPFLEFFDEVRAAPESVCGAALMTGRQFVAKDVSVHAVFRRTKAAEVLAAAKVMAVVSSPITDASGTVRGMISTHYIDRGARSANELAMLGAIARHAGALLGQSNVIPIQ